MADRKDRLPHLLVKQCTSTHPYTRPGTGGGDEFQNPFRTRAQHAESLIRQFENARVQGVDIIRE